MLRLELELYMLVTAPYGETLSRKYESVMLVVFDSVYRIELLIYDFSFLQFLNVLFFMSNIYVFMYNTEI